MTNVTIRIGIFYFSFKNINNLNYIAILQYFFSEKFK